MNTTTKTKSVMYRVSSALTKDNKQCGSMYYFRHRENAELAMLEFESSIVEVPFNSSTSTSDVWYY